MSGISAASRLAFAALLGSAALAGPASAGPVYNGGPEITGTPDVFYIFYGNWQNNNTGVADVINFVKNINGTAYLGTETTMGANGHVTYGGSTTISSITNKSLYLGSSLNGMDPSASIETIVKSALSHGLVPNVANAVYDVLTAPGINVSGFNTQFCGWHSSTNWGGGSLGTQFGFIGDPTASQTGCYAQSHSPNYNFGADAMVSIIAHELIETVTDPTGTAWWDSNPASPTYQNENGDMCAWNFGTVHKLSNGAYYNLSAGTSKYLVQTQWVNTGGLNGGTGGCAMSKSGPFFAPAGGSAGSASFAPVATPEPATLASFGTGILALLFFAGRRRAFARTAG